MNPSLTFKLIWKALGGPDLTPEHRFHPKRKWRFDFALPSKKIAVEIEGGVFTGGRHTRGIGYVNDCEKYNAALLLGWRVFRLPSKMVRCQHVEPIINFVK